jgi:hypothetical protein
MLPFKNTTNRVYAVTQRQCIFVSVFHRILDFKTGQDFYPAPYFFIPFLSPALLPTFAAFKFKINKKYHE